MKRASNFWWDYRYDPDSIIVECDDPKYPVIKIWLDHSLASELAARLLIGALREGRVDYRRTAQQSIAMTAGKSNG